MALDARARDTIVIVSVLVALATIAVAMRLTARFKLALKTGWDDYLCVAALFFLYTMLVELSLWITIGAYGKHLTEVLKESPWELVNFQKILVASEFSYLIVSALSRTSTALFYQRLFIPQLFGHLSTVVVWAVVSWTAVMMIVCGLQCIPLEALWDRTLEANCINLFAWIILNQCFNIAIDFILLGLPLPIILSLRRTWKEKILLSGVFSVGAFVCFSGLYRIVVLFHIDEKDPTYTIVQAGLWTHIEAAVGIICACLPSIRGLFSPASQNCSKRDRSKTGPTPSAYELEDGNSLSVRLWYRHVPDSTSDRFHSDEEHVVEMTRPAVEANAPPAWH